MVSRFTIKTQFIAGFFLVFFITGLFAAFVLSRMQTLSNLNDDIYQHPYAVSNAVRDVNIRIISMHRHMKDAAIANTVVEREAALNRVDLDEAEISNKFGIIRERFLGGKRLIDETVAAIQDWGIIRTEVIELLRNGHKLQAIEITKHKGATQVQVIESRVLNLLKFANTKADEFANKSKEAAQSILDTTLTLMFLFFLTGLLVAFIIYRGLSRQVSALVNAAKSMGEGDYRTPMPDLGNNEHGDLAKEFDHMRISILRSTTEILDARDVAEQANRAKSHFLSNMSHELRTPMHAILSFSKLSLKRVEDEKTRQYIDNIISSGTRLMGLLDDLLDLSKLETGKMEPEFINQDITALIQEQIGEFESILSSNSLLIKTEMEAPVYCSFDRKLMEQVISNILSNAIRYSPPGGTIGISVKQANDVINEKQQNVIELIISDHGIGIPKSELESVFDKFIQSSKTISKAGGTGLGLPICKEIIRIHNGRIWAVSPTEGKPPTIGTAFYIQIPEI